jgi:hypothetical protein
MGVVSSDELVMLVLAVPGSTSVTSMPNFAISGMTASFRQFAIWQPGLRGHSVSDGCSVDERMGNGRQIKLVLDDAQTALNVPDILTELVVGKQRHNIREDWLAGDAVRIAPVSRPIPC